MLGAYLCSWKFQDWPQLVGGASVLETVAGSCARVSYLPCPLVEQASLCPYWDMFTLLVLDFEYIFFLLFDIFVRTPQGRSLSNVSWPNELERRCITVLHFIHVERFL